MSEKLKRFFNQPFNIICGIATLLSLLFGIWGYMQSIREPNLTYYISPTRTPIVQNGADTNISIFYKNNPVKGNISSAEIQIWNAGKKAIRKEDILQQVTIETGTNHPIYQLTFTPSRDVSQINCTATSNDVGIVSVNWKILEQNDGAKLQIIYGGGVELPIKVMGVVEQQKKMSLLGNPWWYAHFNNGWTIIIVCYAAFVGIQFKRNRPISENVRGAFLISMTLLMLISVWVTWHKTLSPPF